VGQRSASTGGLISGDRGRDMEELTQPAGTAALVGVMMALIKLVEKQMAKKNGGSVYTRISLLELQVKELQGNVEALAEKTSDFHREFCEFREEVRINWTKQVAREEALREVRREERV